MTRSRSNLRRALPIWQPHHLIVALSATLILANAAASFGLPSGYGLTGSLLAFALFTLVGIGLTWLVADAFQHQRAATAQLSSSEERLREQTALLQSTLENMGEGLSVFDLDGGLIAWNERFLELLELPPSCGDGGTLRNILTFQARRGDFGPVDPAAHVAERIERFYRDLPTVRERITPSGRTLQIRRNAMPGGGVVTLYSDVTERKAAQEKMEQAWAQAELANRSKGEFLANMSHELRTPLNAIIGFSDLMSKQLLGPMENPRYVEYIGDIHSSARHLLAIINDVLDMSRIEAGKLDLSSDRVNLQEVVRDSLRIVAESARQRGITVSSELPAEDRFFIADERAVKQVLINILSNAVKFSLEGGDIALRANQTESGELIIDIEDHGIGMTADQLARAVKPFEQAQQATTRLYGGTGLGLPIAKALVEAHGGTLTVESRLDQGTTVRLVLPHQHAAVLAAAELLFPTGRDAVADPAPTRLAG